MHKFNRYLRMAAAVITLSVGTVALAACGGALSGEDGAASDASVSAANGGAADSTVSLAEGEATLKAGLEESGFIVGKGGYYEFDTIEGASEGKLMNCFGNNAGSSYTIFDLPDAPGQEVPNPIFPPDQWQYKLRQDEAIVLIAKLPNECRYYSFIDYVMFTEEKEGKDYSSETGAFQVGSEESGYYHPVFGSIGSALNFQNIKHDGDSAYGTTAAIVISANKTTTDKVKAELEKAGFGDGMINLMAIPSGTYNMGLEKGDDTFCFLGRISQPKDEGAYQEYLASLKENSLVYRITPREELEENPYENEVVTPRGDGTHEVAALDSAGERLDQIRDSIIEEYAQDYTYEELRSDIAVPEGLTAYMTDSNAQGDNRDAAYLMTDDFQFTSDEDFVVVYGVNHTATGKAQYSNAVLYSRPMLNGICSVYDSMFEGSANAYLPEGASDASNYYVFKMARNDKGENTALVEYSTGNAKGKYYGADNNTPLFVAFRAYLDKTGVGPSYYECIYDRAIVFHKK